jgi:peptidoglycan hydrolase CwlO-like protein
MDEAATQEVLAKVEKARKERDDLKAKIKELREEMKETEQYIESLLDLLQS